MGISSLVGTEQDSVQAGISQPQGSTPTIPQQVTQDRMLAARDTLISTLDAEMHHCADAAYEALQTASAAIYADLTTRAQSAARLTSWTPPETMPMLALAYEMHHCADAAYEALQTASAAIYADLTTRAQSAARLTSWTPPETMPMLALAYELYADASRDAEIQLLTQRYPPSRLRPSQCAVRDCSLT